MNLREYPKTQLICAYCDTLLPSNAEWCEKCEEYKGVITLAQYEEMFGEDY